jgi:CHAD domain-containing protein
VNGTVERELKLTPPPAFSLARMEPRLDAYVASPVRLKRLHTVYYDTEDLRLTRWGCSLRFRRGEGWTLKIPVPHASAAMYREEHVFGGDETTIPAGALDLATAYLRGATPRRVAELRTLRASRHLLTGGEDVAEVVEDDVRVVEGTRVVQRFRQIEIELTGGAPDDALDVLGALLRHEGAGKPDPVAKNVRALGERALQPEFDVPDLDERSRIGDVARAAFAASVERLVRHDAVLRLAADEEAVHQMRVAVRRMRSDLRTFMPLLDAAWACDLRERMRWVQDGFSGARDADVLLAHLRREAELLPDADRRDAEVAFDPFRAARERAYERVRAMLREPRYAALLQELVEAAKRPPFNAAADERACDAIADLVGGAWSALRKRVRARTRPPADGELHAIRIAAKRARYAVEAAAPVAGRRAHALAEAVEDVQTILGDQHDAVTAREQLRSLAGGEHAFLAGELAALAHRTACAKAGSWRDAWRVAKREHRRFRRAVRA